MCVIGADLSSICTELLKGLSFENGGLLGESQLSEQDNDYLKFNLLIGLCYRVILTRY